MKSFCLYAITLLCCYTATAQNATTKDVIAHNIAFMAKFDSTQRAMCYAANDETFLMYDAFNDHLLTGGQPFEIRYNRGNLLINNDSVPEPYNKQYIARIKKALNRKHVPADKQIFRLYGTKLPLHTAEDTAWHMALIPVKPGSGCRYIPGESVSITRAYEDYRLHTPGHVTFLPHVWQQDAVDAGIIKALFKDKLITKAEKVYLRCNDKDCWINGVKMDAVNSAKYIKLITNKTSIQPTGENDFAAINYNSKDITRLYAGARK